MRLNLTKIDYSKLNAKQQENYNFSKLAALLADYGYTCIRLSDDHQGADLIARHTDGSHVDIQLKSRFSINKKYENPDLYIAAPINGAWYCYPHHRIIGELDKKNIYTDTKSWLEEGSYSAAKVGPEVLEILAPYKL
jgi:hypothetical protein